MAYHKYLFFLLILIAVTSCKKSFLDVPITKYQIAENYVVNLSRAEELLNGTYYNLSTDVYSYESATYADVVADNTKIDGSTLFSQYSWNQLADETPGVSINMNGFWSNSYNVIRFCNYLLERIDGFRNEDPVKADNIKGQALALRALLYSNLLNVFAQPYGFTTDASHQGVPYFTSYAVPRELTRQSVKEMYDYIIADLTNAIQLLAAASTSKTNISRNAAIGLLSRIYLFKGDFTNAKNYARQIATTVPLLPAADYPAKLFTLNDKESLFWLAPLQTGNSSAAATSYPGYIYTIPSTNRFFSTNDLVSIIKERPLDLRNNWFKDTLGSKMVKKYPVGAVSGIVDTRRSNYYPIIRSSELFLTAAESYAKIGNEDSARYFLDQVRKRADVTAPISAATGAALLDSIYKERRKELCFEGIRMFDLLRTGKGVTRSDVTSLVSSNLPFPNDKAISPIPLVDVRTYSLQQNNNY